MLIGPFDGVGSIVIAQIHRRARFVEQPFEPRPLLCRDRVEQRLACTGLVAERMVVPAEDRRHEQIGELVQGEPVYVVAGDDELPALEQQQILSLLKVGEPRFVIYAYGQSLKPADRSILSSGPFTGMSTNYQITGETATRTLIRIEGAPNKPRAVIESFNVLPPD